MISRKKLSEIEIQRHLKDAPGWTHTDGRLGRQFATGNFSKGVEFTIKIAAVADALNHHPDILLTYPRVTVEIYTHDVGGITEFDFELAKQINALTE